MRNIGKHGKKPDKNLFTEIADGFRSLIEKKSEAVLGAIRGGYISTLITDEKCADKILKFANG